MKKWLQWFILVALITSIVLICIRIAVVPENTAVSASKKNSAQENGSHIQVTVKDSSREEKRSTLTQGFTIRKTVAMSITTNAEVSVLVEYVVSNGRIGSISKVTSYAVGSNQYEWMQSSYTTKLLDSGRSVEITINGIQIEKDSGSSSNEPKKTEGTVVVELSHSES